MRTKRWLRKRQIVRVLNYLHRPDYRVWDKPQVNYPTMTDIAFWLNLKPSNHLLKLLHEMENDGLISSIEFDYRPGIVARSWHIAEHGEQLLAEMKKERLPL